MSSNKLMEKVKRLLKKRGTKAYEIAKEEILNEEIKYEPIRDALRYFMQELWHNFQHPALLSLTCESVGGDPEDTTSIGAALVLLTGAADIHDDIIDQSETKGSKPTVLGKFGRDIALLIGDALLLKGFTLLGKACKSLPKKEREMIMKLVREAFFEIGTAEAKETSFRGNWDLPPEEYLDIIKMKAAIADVTARIGAILGDGNLEEINLLGHYGRTLGILMTIRDDFIDLFEPDELRNRVQNECLPLPILYAFRNTRKKREIVQLFKSELAEQETRVILNLVIDTKEVQELKEYMQLLIRKEEDSLSYMKRNKNTLHLLLRSILEDL
jgi:geranylgeranyl diphosphate synthase type I